MYLVYICPKLEYNTPIWSPYLKKDINHLESIYNIIKENIQEQSLTVAIFHTHHTLIDSQNLVLSL